MLRRTHHVTADALTVAILTDPGGSVLRAIACSTRASSCAFAILTDPGGSVLPPTRVAAPWASPGCCDPHRPRRVGAACCRLPAEEASPILVLRSSPTPEGRCCPRPRPARAGPVRGVAILTDPGGSVLPPGPTGRPRSRPNALRSSPTPEGRCCRRSPTRGGGRSPKLRSSPTPEGRCCSGRAPVLARASRRCCDPHRPRRVGAAPVAGALEVLVDAVAILTDPGGSVLPRSAYVVAASHAMVLRSSPTPEGRCCSWRCPTRPGSCR